MAAGRLSDVRRVILTPAVIQATLRTLQEFGAQSKEGLVLWLGKIEPGQAQVLRVLIPKQNSISDEDGVGYFVTGETLFRLNQALAETGLRLIAQIHSHPGDAYHSHTDDRYAIVTAEGGLSLVVPDFGQAPADLTSWAVYRLGQRGWQELDLEEIRSLFEVRVDR
jgi:Prokaryotic homologs of the JAB domain